jgi:thymidylate synthase
MVEQYLEHARAILTNELSGYKGGSKGSGLISRFSHYNEYDLRKGFPLLTTKKVFTKSVGHELAWFMRGDSNIKYLEDREVPIWRGNAFEFNLPAMIEEGTFPEIEKYSPQWDESMEEYGERVREDEEFAQRFGDAGPIYGSQWRHWKYYDEETGKLTEIDQLGDLMERIRRKPTSKRHIVTAWNPGDADRVSLPPCHILFQATVNDEGQLDLSMYQRSCDMFLGVPFNIVSYAALTHVIAQETGFEARLFGHHFGDVHLYTGLEKRSQWYRENFHELRKRVRNVSDREEYLDVLEWINRNSPEDPNEEKYDHVTAILEQLSRKPLNLSRFEITGKKQFDEITADDLNFTEYEHHPAIRRAMAV